MEGFYVSPVVSEWSGELCLAKLKEWFCLVKMSPIELVDHVKCPNCSMTQKSIRLL